MPVISSLVIIEPAESGDVIAEDMVEIDGLGFGIREHLKKDLPAVDLCACIRFPVPFYDGIAMHLGIAGYLPLLPCERLYLTAFFLSGFPEICYRQLAPAHLKPSTASLHICSSSISSLYRLMYARTSHFVRSLSIDLRASGSPAPSPRITATLSMTTVLFPISFYLQSYASEDKRPLFPKNGDKRFRRSCQSQPYVHDSYTYIVPDTPYSG